MGEHYREPWEKMEEEQSQSFAFFVIYRTLGPMRTLAATATQAAIEYPSVTYKSIGSLSNRNHWSKRAERWDMEQDRILRAQQRHSIDEMNARHIELSLKAQTIVEQTLDKYIADAENLRLTPTAAMAMLKLSIEVERQARGEAGTITETREDSLEKRRENYRRAYENPEGRAALRVIANIGDGESIH